MRNTRDPENRSFAAKLTALISLTIIGLLSCLLLFSGFLSNFQNSYREAVPAGTPILSRVQQAIHIYDQIIVEKAPFHDGFIEIYGAFQKVMGKRTIPDPNYGFLFLTKENQIVYQINQRDLTEAAEKITTLFQALSDEDIPFLWVQAPFKLMDGEEVRQISFNYSGENTDSFLNSLKEGEVSILDLRPFFQDLKKQGTPAKDLFFNTDHHWTVPAALKATALIAENLDTDYHININTQIYDSNNFSMTTMDRSFIGSMGRRTGRIFGGIDDFTLVLPTFETDIYLSESDYGVIKSFRGPFEESVLVKEYIEDSSPTSNRYAAYHGDNEELIFINQKLQEEGNRTKLLIIKDSFGLPVYSFLSLGVGELRALDPRLYKGSLLEYAKEYEPDILIFLYNEDSLNSNMFTWKL